MSMFMPPVGALAGSAPIQAGSGTDQIKGQANASDFSSVFLQGMLKEIFKNQWKSGLIDDNISNSLYAEMFTEEMIKQLAESDAFGLNELINERIAKDRNGSTQQ